MRLSWFRPRNITKNERQRCWWVIGSCATQYMFIVWYLFRVSHISYLSLGFNHLIIFIFFFLLPMMQEPNRLRWFALLHARRKTFHWGYNDDETAFIVYLNEHGVPLLLGVDVHHRTLTLLDYIHDEHHSLQTQCCLLSSVLYLRLGINRLLDERLLAEPAGQQAERAALREWLEGHILSWNRMRKLKLLLSDD